MGRKLRKVTIAVLLAGSAALFVAPPAEANRGGPTTTTTEPSYVPPPQYGQNPQPVLTDEPSAPVVAPVVPVDLPGVAEPNAGQAGSGEPLGPAPEAGSPGDVVAGESTTRPDVPADDGFLGGVLSRTGSETMPMVRAGLAALALGLGLVALARRRRVDTAASA